MLNATPLFAFSTDDKITKRLCMAQLSQQKLGTHEEIARAFHCSRNTVHRTCKAYMKAGLPGLILEKTGPKTKRTSAGLVSKIIKLRKAEETIRFIGTELGVSKSKVHSVCKEHGLIEEQKQKELDLKPQRTTAAPASQPKETEAAKAIESPARKTNETGCPGPVSDDGLMEDASEEEISAYPVPTLMNETEVEPGEAAPPRSLERVLASCGKLGLPEVEAEFVSGSEVPAAGSLLGMAFLTEEGSLEVARKVYGRLSNGFYGLRNTVLTLFLGALLRVKTVDAFQHGTPHLSGRLIGLDRLPETRTISRKLKEIAQRKLGREFMEERAKRHIEANKDVCALLYIDGHVRVYHGKRKVRKHMVNRMGRCKKSIVDYWVHDGNGAPILKIDGDYNDSVQRIVKDELGEIHAWVGKDQWLTVIVDREAWSPQLFDHLRSEQVYIVTYRKNRNADYPASEFTKTVVLPKRPKGKPKKLQVRDQSVTISNMEFRSVAFLQDDRQVEIILTDKERPVEKVIHDIANRWCQENDFKYRRHQSSLDRIRSYAFEPVPADQKILNPAHTQLDKQVKQAEKILSRLMLARSDKKKKSPKPEEVRTARKELNDLQKQRRAVGMKIRVGDLPEDERPELQVPEKKLFFDVIEMAADSIERRLLGMLASHYKQHRKDGRELLRQIFNNTGDLHVENGCVTVRLNYLASPNQTQAMEGLCNDINHLNPKFPESDIRLRFDVHPHPDHEM